MCFKAFNIQRNKEIGIAFGIEYWTVCILLCSKGILACLNKSIYLSDYLSNKIL